MVFSFPDTMNEPSVAPGFGTISLPPSGAVLFNNVLALSHTASKIGIGTIVNPESAGVTC